MEAFIREHPYVDYAEPLLGQCAAALFSGQNDPVQQARRAYHFVRDEIPHSFDCAATVITARASEVLRHETGICHAKANLLAALLRRVGIPTGFCFQHLTLLDDDSRGYCLHCFNAVHLNGAWVRLDARGNTGGRKAAFSLAGPVLAFPNRPEYDEYFWDGIYPDPHPATMAMLEAAHSLEDVMANLGDSLEDDYLATGRGPAARRVTRAEDLGDK